MNYGMTINPQFLDQRVKYETLNTIVYQTAPLAKLVGSCLFMKYSVLGETAKEAMRIDSDVFDIRTITISIHGCIIPQ